MILDLVKQVSAITEIFNMAENYSRNLIFGLLAWQKIETEQTVDFVE